MVGGALTKRRLRHISGPQFAFRFGRSVLSLQRYAADAVRAFKGRIQSDRARELGDAELGVCRQGQHEVQAGLAGSVFPAVRGRDSAPDLQSKASRFQLCRVVDGTVAARQ